MSVSNFVRPTNRWARKPPISSRTPTELDSVAEWEEALAEHFVMEHEVRGQHWTGANVRIDALLHPTFDWPSGGRHPIGLEVKRSYGHVADFTKAYGQAEDYAQSVWFSNRFDEPIRVYVSIFDLYTNEHTRTLMDRVAGRNNVAFWREEQWNGLTLRTSGNTRWTERHGRDNAAFSAIPRVGSR